MTKEFDERNMAKSRRVCEDMEAAHVTKWLKLTERERAILAMWPRFEDGEPVMVGDRFIDHKVNERTARSVIVNNDGVELRTFDGTFDWHETGERVKRPAPKVLDADGVEIHVGDTVWHCNGIASGVVASIDADSLMNTTRYVDESGTEFRDAARSLTHTRPDSWERLEEDAADLDDMPCDFNAKDLIRRAKALAEAEVGR